MNELNWFPNNIVVCNPIQYGEGRGGWNNMDSSVYPQRPMHQISPVRPVPSRGYRRGNTISSYHQPSLRYPAYPRKHSWQRSDWDDVHLPNYEDQSDSEFDRPRSPPRGHQNRCYPQDGYGGYNNNNYRYGQSQPSNTRGAPWRGVDRRANSRNISHVPHKPDKPRQYPIKPHSDSTSKEIAVKPAVESVDNFATKLSNVNKQILFEKYDGKVFNTKDIENNNNEPKAPIETIPLLLNTKRRDSNVLDVDKPLVIDLMSPSDSTEIPMEIEDPDSPSASFPVDTPIEECVTITDNKPNNKPPDKDENVVSVDLVKSSECVTTADNKLNDATNKPPDKDEDIVFVDVKSALHLPVRIVEQPKPKKINIRMNIQLSPPKIILDNSEALPDVAVEKNPLELPQLEREKDPLEIDEKNNDLLKILEHFTPIPTTDDTETIEDTLRKLTEETDKTEAKNASAETESLKRKDSSTVLRDESNNKKYKRSTSDTKKCKPSKSSTSENAPPSSAIDDRGFKKHKTSHHSKSKSIDHKEHSKKQESIGHEKPKDSKPARIEKRRNSLVKVRHKGRESCDEQVAKDKRNVTDSSNDEQTKCTNISVIKEIASNIPEPHMRNLENIMDSLRKNDSYLHPTAEDESFTKNFATVFTSELDVTRMCDDEVDQIISQTTAQPAKIRKRRCATLDSQYNRSKSMDAREKSCSPTISLATSPAKIIKRRRTIVDASEAATDTTGRPRRSRSRNNKYLADPDFKAKVDRANTPIRITRSKSKEILSRRNSMDALVPHSPDDPDFFQQNTPPATPRTPRQGDTPDILRTLNMKSTNSNSGLEMHEETQDMGHVYAPALFSSYDLTVRLDPRLNRASSMAAMQDEEDTFVVVDDITLQNTLANKVSVPAKKVKKLSEPCNDTSAKKVSASAKKISKSANKLSAPASKDIPANKASSPEPGEDEDTSCRDNLRIIITKLTDKDVHHIQTNLSGTKPKKVKKDRRPKQEDSNKFSCSIPIASIGLPDLTDSGFNANVVDDILKLMDSAPISSKNDIPKIRKSIDQLDMNSMPVDNAITKPLSSKPVKQTTALKTFDTFATVSTDSEQTPPRPQLAKPETKETKLRRLFEVEAKQIYMPMKKIRVCESISKKKKKAMVRYSVESTCPHLPFDDKDLTPMWDFFVGVDIGNARTLIEQQYLRKGIALPLIETGMSETAYSPYEDDDVIQDDEVMDIDKIFDNDHDNDVGNLIINGEPSEGLTSSSGGDFKDDSKTSVPTAKAYQTPTIVATIDLLTKEEEEAAALAQQRVAAPVTRPKPNSILIVNVTEYALNVTATIGQYIQMEKVRLRTIDMVKKSTANFALDIISCDDSVDDFRKSYSLKLGKKFVDYTDSIEIQNFSVTILYTTLTESCLKYNAFKIKKLDVANAICDLYDAVGQQHKRSVFCKQLFQLSNHMKEIELAVELERNENQNNTSVNSTTSTPETSVAVATETPNPTLVSTSSHRTVSTSSTASLHSVSVPIVPSLPVAQVAVSPVPCSSNSPVSFAVPVAQSTPELGINPPGVVVHHAPAVIQQIPQFSTPQAYLASSQSQTVARPPDNLTNVINSVAQNATVVQGVPHMHTVVVSQGRQTDLSYPNPQNRRRIKYTPPLHKQQQNQPTEQMDQVPQNIVFSPDEITQYKMQCQLYNHLVRHQYRMLGIQPPTRTTEEPSLNSAPSSNTNVSRASSTYWPQSNDLVTVNQARNLHVGPDTRSLLNFRPDFSKRPQKSASHVPIPSVVPPVMQSRAKPAPNPRIAVRNIDQMRQPIPQTNQNQSKDSMADQAIVTMMAEIEDAATKSCVSHTDQITTSPTERPISNNEDTIGTETDPIVPRNLSRDSGNSSGELGEEARDAADFSCVCGKSADMICSCKLIVYCSAECQGKDWSRHITDHV